MTLVTRIMKLVNSALYGLSRKIGSVERAVVVLGASVVKNLAIAASMSSLVKGRKIGCYYHPKDIWRHSLATAELQP